jgi:hypothetical protein
VNPQKELDRKLQDIALQLSQLEAQKGNATGSAKGNLTKQIKRLQKEYDDLRKTADKDS